MLNKIWILYLNVWTPKISCFFTKITLTLGNWEQKDGGILGDGSRCVCVK